MSGIVYHIYHMVFFLSQMPFIWQCKYSALVIPLDWEEMSCHPVYTTKFLALSDGKVYVPSLMVLVIWTKLKHVIMLHKCTWFC